MSEELLPFDGESVHVPMALIVGAGRRSRIGRP